MAIKTYNPKDTTITIGTHIVKDYDNGQFIEVAFEEDTYEHLSSADGIEMRIKKNDNRATATITLMQSSESAVFLNGVYLADRITDAGVLPFQLKDTRTGDLIVTEACWIRRAPTYTRGNSKEAISFQLSLSSPDITLGLPA